MYNIEQSTKFKKDLKKYEHDKEKLIVLNDVVKHLETDGSVPEEHYPHPLKGKYSGTMECHIQNDILLIMLFSSFYITTTGFQPVHEGRCVVKSVTKAPSSPWSRLLKYWLLASTCTEV